MGGTGPRQISVVHHGEERRPSAPFARPRASKRRERMGALVSVAVGAPRARAGPQAFPALDERGCERSLLVCEESLLAWESEVYFPLLLNSNLLGTLATEPCMLLYWPHTIGNAWPLDVVSGFLVISLSLANARARAHAYGPAPDLNSHMLCPRILPAY